MGSSMFGTSSNLILRAEESIRGADVSVEEMSLPDSPVHVQFLSGTAFAFDNSPENPALEKNIMLKHRTIKITLIRYFFPENELLLVLSHFEGVMLL